MLLSMLLATTIGACSQPLTSKMTGTGGTETGTGTGDTGGSPYPGAGGYPGTGGSPGTGGTESVPAVCNTLAAEYESALTAAESCEVGASGQCQQVVSRAPSGCSCPTYATDSSVLATIANAWQAAGCASGTEPPCTLCVIAPNSTCVSADGGSAGFCSYVPGTGGNSGTGGDGATGGSTGAGGSSADGGLAACSTFASEYAAVLVGAKSCTAGAAGQCAQEVPSALSLCPVCGDFVTDRSVLDIIRTNWDAAGCGDVSAVACPAVSCLPPTTGTCVPSDAGGSVCSNSYQPILPD